MDISFNASALIPLIILRIGAIAIANGLIRLLIGLVLAGVVHEFGHCISASIFEKSLNFTLKISKLWYIPIPRFVWEMPEDVTIKQNNIIALAGFGLELLLTLIMILGKLFGYSLPNVCNYYIIASIIHLIFYRLYAGDYDDFKLLIKNSEK